MKCDHFPACGGCQFLDRSEKDERALKSKNFLDAMRSIGSDATNKDYIASPLHSRRRATLSAKRTKKSAMIGFTEARTHTVVDMQMCLILEPEILALKPILLTMMTRIASRSALVKFHITKLAHGFDLSIENAKPIDPETTQWLAQLTNDAQIHRLIVNGELVFQDAPCQIDIGGTLITIPPQPFLQATRHAEGTLRTLAHEAVRHARKLADLFAGIGTFSYGLTSEVHAYEGDAQMSNAMQDNLNHNAMHNIKAMNRDLFRDPLSPSELDEFDAVIIDPPRAGAKSQCLALAQSNVPTIAFVSCDAASFARDAEILIQGGYEMQPITLIDQFRFSNHLESFTVFEKLR